MANAQNMGGQGISQWGKVRTTERDREETRQVTGQEMIRRESGWGVLKK